MRKINRRSFLTFATALVPAIFFNKTEAASSTLGTFLIKSSAIKVGQTQAYAAEDSNGRSLEIILTRTKTGLFAFDGTCTHQGCQVDIKRRALVCPCHGSVFNPRTGAVIFGPDGSSKDSIKPLTKFKVTDKSGKIYIK